MNLLADESIDKQMVERLRLDGHTVIYIAEIEPSISDDLVLQKANENSSLLLTADKDFGELVFHKQLLSSGGVVLIRLFGLSAERKSEIISRLLLERTEDVKQAFSVVSPGSVRIRKFGSPSLEE
jgi:predicted nuclease of predicted toxin-antitoxin system